MSELIIIPRIKSFKAISKALTKIHGERWKDCIYKDEFIPGFRDCYYCEQYGKEVAAVHRYL
jgi:hypothetical protein